MNFFEHQDRAKRNSKKLVLFYTIALISMITLIGVVPAIIVHNSGGDGIAVFLGASGIVLLIAGVGTAVKFAWLNKGGPHVAESLGGRLVSTATRDAKEKMLINVVEEMSIASGCPMPSVYLLEGEGSINAFAAGLRLDNAVIAVTRGCLEKLSRDELQGVVAHEYSHIIHGDMRLNLRLIGTIAGITTLAYVGEILFRVAGRGSNKDGRAGAALGAIGLIFFIGGWLGVLFGSIIKAMVSRQREFLADASAVQYTRSHTGIAGALKTIGGFTNDPKLKAANARDVSHMFFSKGISSIFASHPPLEKRIQRIEADWASSKSSPAAITGGSTDMAMGFANTMAPTTEAPPATIHLDDAGQVIKSVGEISPSAVAYAAELRNQIPEALLDAAHDVYTSRALIFAFLLDEHDAKAKAKQLEIINGFGSSEFVQLTTQYGGAIASLDRRQVLPLFEIARHSLVDMSQSQGIEFLNTINALVKADHHISMFEWVLYRLTKRTLEIATSAQSKPKAGNATIASQHIPASKLLSVLCHAGHNDEVEAEKAFEDARTQTGWHWLTLLSREESTALTLNGTIAPLAMLRPADKQLLINAAICSALSDGEITVSEGELLRATSELLGCPMPPLR